MGYCSEQNFSSHVGQECDVDYKIDLSTNMQYVKVSIAGIPVPMAAMGIWGTYSFISTSIPSTLEDWGVERVLFSMSTNFTNPSCVVMLPAYEVPPDVYAPSCLLSNGNACGVSDVDESLSKATTSLRSSAGHWASGNFTLSLSTLSLQTGQDCVNQTQNGYCSEQNFSSNVGQECEVDYRIDLSTNMQYVNVSIAGVRVPMAAMGLWGTYSFISTSIPSTLEDWNVERVLFSMSTNFTNPSCVVIFPAYEVPPDVYAPSCLLSNGNACGVSDVDESLSKATTSLRSSAGH